MTTANTPCTVTARSTPTGTEITVSFADHTERGVVLSPEGCPDPYAWLGSLEHLVSGVNVGMLDALRTAQAEGEGSWTVDSDGAVEAAR